MSKSSNVTKEQAEILPKSKADMLTQKINNINEIKASDGKFKEAVIEGHVTAAKAFCAQITDDKEIEKLVVDLSKSAKTLEPEVARRFIETMSDVTKDNPKLITLGPAIKAETYLTNEIKACKERNKAVDSVEIARISNGLNTIAGEILKNPTQMKEFAAISKDLVRECAAQDKQLSFIQKIKYNFDKVLRKETPEKKMDKILGDYPQLKEALKKSFKLADGKPSSYAHAPQQRSEQKGHSR